MMTYERYLDDRANAWSLRIQKDKYRMLSTLIRSGHTAIGTTTSTAEQIVNGTEDLEDRMGVLREYLLQFPKSYHRTFFVKLFTAGEIPFPNGVKYPI